MLWVGIAVVVVALVVVVLASRLDGAVFGDKVTEWPERWTKS